jgi:CubicO group peptidase (beta-lactamase class C family)
MKRIGRIIIYAVVVLGIFYAVMVLTGNTHIYKTLRNTVFKGKLSPSLDDYIIFTNDTVYAGFSKPWKRDSTYNTYKFNVDESDYHLKFQTVAFAVIKNGKLIFDHYWEGYSDSSFTNSWSMAKSITSILIGIAIREGKINGVDQLAEDFLPHLKGSGITIGHLLSMSSNLSFSESYINPFGFAAKALYGDNLEELLPRYAPKGRPGEFFDYESGNSVLLGMILKKATGTNISQYASEKLWKKIGAVQSAIWSLDREGGIEKTFCCFNSNALDFARLGQLYLANGVWEGDTIVDPEFVKLCTSLSPTKLDDGSDNDRYGYHWWITNFKNKQIFYARGIKGQYIFVIPSKNIVVVRLGRERDEYKIKGVPRDVYKYLEMGMKIIN